MIADKKSGVKILVVDDHVDSADSLALYLRVSGYEVLPVYTGADALKAVTEFPPDLVLLDINMPGLNGYDTMRCLREHPGSAQALFVAMSGYSAREKKKMALDAGFDHYLVKPLEPEQLEQFISEKVPAKRVH
jgi:CheY-like chemotaxis protein